MDTNKNNLRFCARVTVETETPLAVGSGEKGIAVDRLVAKDANGLPYIPGTGLAGVLRHSFGVKPWLEDVFGSGGQEGKGSRLILSPAHMIGSDGKTVIEGLQDIDLNDKFYSYFIRLPERDHVRISHKGSVEAHGKFDEQLVHKGVRFVFNLELIGRDEDKPVWEDILAILASPGFRLGAGTRKGFGRLKIIKEGSKGRIFRLDEDGLKDYIKKSGSLNDKIDDQWAPITFGTTSKENDKEWQKYTLELKPKDFFLFGAGFGDLDADNKSKTEKFFSWDSGKPELIEEEAILIPATSLKGALSHRTAFHYNRLKNVTIEDTGSGVFVATLDVEKAIDRLIDSKKLTELPKETTSEKWAVLRDQIQNLNLSAALEEFKQELIGNSGPDENNGLPVAENNDAVKTLFGFARNSGDIQQGRRGHVIIDDVYLPFQKSNEKVFNHVKIDRFTGGGIAGALFQEKAYTTTTEVQIDIWVENAAFDSPDGPLVKQAFEAAINDLKTGRLPLGGNTAKGHGIFYEAKKV